MSSKYSNKGKINHKGKETISSGYLDATIISSLKKKLKINLSSHISLKTVGKTVCVTVFIKIKHDFNIPYPDKLILKLVLNMESIFNMKNKF